MLAGLFEGIAVGGEATAGVQYDGTGVDALQCGELPITHFHEEHAANGMQDDETGVAALLLPSCFSFICFLASGAGDRLPSL